MKTEQPLTSAFLTPVKNSSPWRKFAVLTAGLVLVFSFPLYDLGRFAAASDLYSYIFLMPFVSGYLIWLQRGKLPGCSGPAPLPALIFFLGGLGMIAGYVLARNAGRPLSADDYLAWMMSAFFLFFVAGCFWSLGRALMRALVFPIGLLIFLVPMPTFLLNGTEAFLQQGSALAAEGFLQLAGATFYRDGLMFKLPTITLEVAPECSGIHSTLVLLITSLVAGQMFLRSPWRRTVLALVVIPLALLRNGFRVFVIGELCTHIGPEMIDSPIHRHGGPLFFALSLIPFFLFLFFLRKREQADLKRK